MNRFLSIFFVVVVTLSFPAFADFEVVDPSVKFNKQNEEQHAKGRAIFKAEVVKKKCKISKKQFHSIKTRVDLVRGMKGVAEYANRYSDIFGPRGFQQSFEYIYGIPQNRSDDFKNFFLNPSKRAKIKLPEFCA